ncbi:MAG: hypothetical protein M0R03_03915 [Novosphingobium sp.]|nr:hypothetical protein [Novosphingobium sp.]
MASSEWVNILIIDGECTRSRNLRKFGLKLNVHKTSLYFEEKEKYSKVIQERSGCYGNIYYQYLKIIYKSKFHEILFIGWGGYYNLSIKLIRDLNLKRYRPYSSMSSNFLGFWSETKMLINTTNKELKYLYVPKIIKDLYSGWNPVSKNNIIFIKLIFKKFNIKCKNEIFYCDWGNKCYNIEQNSQNVVYELFFNKESGTIKRKLAKILYKIYIMLGKDVLFWVGDRVYNLSFNSTPIKIIFKIIKWRSR